MKSVPVGEEVRGAGAAVHLYVRHGPGLLGGPGAVVGGPHEPREVRGRLHRQRSRAVLTHQDRLVLGQESRALVPRAVARVRLLTLRIHPQSPETFIVQYYIFSIQNVFKTGIVYKS